MQPIIKFRRIKNRTGKKSGRFLEVIFLDQFGNQFGNPIELRKFLEGANLKMQKEIESYSNRGQDTYMHYIGIGSSSGTDILFGRPVYISHDPAGKRFVNFPGQINRKIQDLFEEMYIDNTFKRIR